MRNHDCAEAPKPIGSTFARLLPHIFENQRSNSRMLRFRSAIAGEAYPLLRR